LVPVHVLHLASVRFRIQCQFRFWSCLLTTDILAEEGEEEGIYFSQNRDYELIKYIFNKVLFFLLFRSLSLCCITKIKKKKISIEQTEDGEISVVKNVMHLADGRMPSSD
jgi:hypothetical protein